MDSAQWKLIKDAFAAVGEMPPDDRQAFLNGLDASVRADVERLIKADREAEDFIEKPVVAPRADRDTEEMPTAIDDYTIVEKLGSGGMGTVYLAHHAGEGFSQQVALKLIKRGMDTGLVLKRFLIERQILAALDHPNIARMLDGGSTPDGLPYFVMEYVDGREIREFCTAEKYGLDERLELFRKVCSAVVAAHRNLVVHRDLKPSNILVTRDGEPKLLDFGIAKLLSPDWSSDTDEATVTQFRVMTPEYASPEQIEGKATSTSTDVYSLGVILYELLTGARPYDTKGKAPNELIQFLLSSEPPRPSTAARTRESGKTASDTPATGGGEDPLVRMTARIEATGVEPKRLQGDLDNIVLKALRREQDRRYQSVEEFAEDVRKFQAGLPVTATADSRSYRLKKFIRRHRTGAVGVSVAAALLIAATGVTGWQYTVANRERNMAEQRFAQVRALARSMIFEYYDGIAAISGTTEIRQKMVTDALQYLDGLAAEGTAEPSLKREIAEGYEKIGDLLGNPFRYSGLGDTKGAVESYRKSFAIRQELFDADQNNVEDLIGIRNGEMRMCEGLWALGGFTEAKGHCDKSVSYTQEAERRGVENDRGAAIDSYNRSSQVREQLADYDGALAIQQTALAMTKADLAADPDDLKKAMAVAACEVRLGDITYQKRDYSGSLQHMLNALPAVERMYEQNKDAAKPKYNLAMMYGRVAAVQVEVGEVQPAVEYNRKAVALSEEIVAEDPKNNLSKMNLATLVGNYAESLCRTGKTSECFEQYHRSIKIYDDVYGADPSYNYSKGNYVSTQTYFADNLLKAGRTDEAVEHYAKALSMAKQLSAETQADEYFADIYAGLGNAALAKGKTPANIKSAKENFELAKPYFEKLKDAGALIGAEAEKYQKMLSKLESIS
ncbi:MAG TPA: serine/threonine-protein kinase [Pyrinomonadaceae bacterium]|nr:serine/threonine-protein kinase [Pyrinomonadaceae bacterium]